MWQRVPALPNHVTSMRRAPIAASVNVAPATRTSRTRTATAYHTGTLPSIEDRADRDEEEHPIGDGIEDLAELRRLVEVAGDVTVDEVGRAERSKEQGGRNSVPLVEQKPQEDRQAEQPHDGDRRWGS